MTFKKFFFPQVSINKKNIIIEHGKNLAQSSPIVRINKFIGDIIDAQVINPYTLEAHEVNTEIENIIISYDSYYNPHNLIIEFIKLFPKANLFYLINDYNIPPYSTLSNLLVERKCKVISSFEKFHGTFKYSKMFTVNLNCIEYTEINPLQPHKEKNIPIYWGRWRNGRLKYFDKYFYNMHLSCSKGNIKKFQKLPNFNKRNIVFLPTLNEKTFSEYSYGLYIEDEFSHDNYCYMAARWYEALKYNILMFFDNSCKNTILKSYYNIPKFLLVDNRPDIEERIKSPMDIKQFYSKYTKIALSEKMQLIDEIKLIFK